MANSLASCQNEKCPSKDTCKRYNTECAIINFSSYMDEETMDKCPYYVKKDGVLKE